MATFFGIYHLPIGNGRFDNAVFEALELTRWYAREHVLFCLVPAFFIAGAIGVFVNSSSVMRYLGAKANKVLAYGVASISGSVLAVCSCTVLPLFGGIYRMGAGLGPASAFLYSGPAINVLAIILTARVLGIELGVARTVGAVLFSIVVGLAMHVIFRNSERDRVAAQMVLPEMPAKRSLWQNALFFASMIGILVFANWSGTAEEGSLWMGIFRLKWLLTGFSAVILGVILTLWFGMVWWKVLIAGLPSLALASIFPDHPHISFTAGFIGLAVLTGFDKGEGGEWLTTSWEFAKQILPMLMFGVFIAGFALGRPGHEGIIPSAWVSRLVGGNSIEANFFASVVAAFMYFATLTEIPILQSLIGGGMGKGPALALLLAGPALSLPSMLVIKSIIGLKKTVVFVVLVIVMATISGMIFGRL